MSDKHCEICGGEGWVCEVHDDRAWNEGAGHIVRKHGGKISRCDAAGKPCKCNKHDPPWRHPGYNGDINGAGSDPDVP